jgi:hypothetical protein
MRSNLKAYLRKTTLEQMAATLERKLELMDESRHGGT